MVGDPVTDGDFWLRLVAGTGFPVAVTFWLLVRIEPRIDSLTNAVTKLTEAINVWMQRK